MTTLRFLAVVFAVWCVISIIAAGALSALFRAARGGES